MKKIIVLCLAAIVGVGSALALPKGATAPRLLVKSHSALMAPVWSPDGSRIAVTTDNFTGILVADHDGKNLRAVTNDAGAGYKMAWTPDGSQILGRTNIVERGLVLHEVKAYDVATAKSTTLVTKSRFDGTPSSAQAKTLKTVRALKPVSVFERMLNNPAEVASSVAGLRQFKGEVVINPALSPDGSRIAFQIAGKGIFVCDANGNNVVNLCKGSHPAWLNDNRTIVMTVVSDDGMRFTASTLYAIDVVNGSKVALVNKSNIIPRTPAVAPDGKTIAFQNANDFAIYTVTLKF